MTDYLIEILAIDGSVRDLNFPRLDIERLEKLMKHLKSDYHVESAYLGKGNDEPFEDVTKQILKSIGQILSLHPACNLHLGLNSPTNLLSPIQILIDPLKPGSTEYQVELSIAPEDLQNKSLTLDIFLKFIEGILKATNTKEYYFRYENVSWVSGNTEKGSGVIFSHKDIPLNPRK